jgi:hypothetical protein
MIRSLRGFASCWFESLSSSSRSLPHQLSSPKPPFGAASPPSSTLQRYPRLNSRMPRSLPYTKCSTHLRKDPRGVAMMITTLLWSIAPSSSAMSPWLPVTGQSSSKAAPSVGSPGTAAAALCGSWSFTIPDSLYSPRPIRTSTVGYSPFNRTRTTNTATSSWAGIWAPRILNSPTSASTATLMIQSQQRPTRAQSKTIRRHLLRDKDAQEPRAPNIPVPCSRLVLHEQKLPSAPRMSNHLCTPLHTM